MPLKTFCPHCSAKLVLKHEHAPAQVACPKCRQKFRPDPVGAVSDAASKPRAKRKGQTENEAPKSSPKAAERKPGGSAADLMRAVVHAFEGQAVHRPPTIGYRLALLLSACGLCLLIVAYIACLAGIGFGLYAYCTKIVPVTLQVRGRAMILVAMMHLAVVGAGLAVLVSMIVPLFRWSRGRSESPLLHSAAHPVLHSFVRALCDLIGAPQPDEIRLNLLPNASAARQGGFLGLVGGRLVLEIGAPLFYGLNLRALAGVIAHELGHFSQATSSLIFRYVANVTNWFNEAAGRTGGVQELIREEASDTGGGAGLLMLVAYCTAGLGKLVLALFALLSRVIAYYLLRQMEFDADRYEAEVAGSAQFARTFERLTELDVAFEMMFKAMLRGEIEFESPLEMAEQVVDYCERMPEKERRRAARAMKPRKAHWFDSHPSPTERIAAVARRPHAGIFQLEGAALHLLNVAALSKASG
jgi:Zn-dependent protease with chaperone function